MFTTPKREQRGANDAYSTDNNRASPEGLFTPLRVPGTTKNDSNEASKYLSILTHVIESQVLKKQCYCIPEFG
jgi:hypothetical protein